MRWTLGGECQSSTAQHRMNVGRSVKHAVRSAAAGLRERKERAFMRNGTPITRNEVFASVTWESHVQCVFSFPVFPFLVNWITLAPPPPPPSPPILSTNSFSPYPLNPETFASRSPRTTPAAATISICAFSVPTSCPSLTLESVCGEGMKRGVYGEMGGKNPISTCTQHRITDVPKHHAARHSTTPAPGTQTLNPKP